MLPKEGPTLVSQTDPGVIGKDTACAQSCVVNLVQLGLHHLGRQSIKNPVEVANAVRTTTNGHTVSEIAGMLENSFSHRFKGQKTEVTTKQLNTDGQNHPSLTNSIELKDFKAASEPVPSKGRFSMDIATMVLTNKNQYEGGHTILIQGYDKSTNELLVIDPYNAKRVVNFQPIEREIELNGQRLKSIQLVFKGPFEHYIDAPYVYLDGIYIVGLASAVVGGT